MSYYEELDEEGRKEALKFIKKLASGGDKKPVIPKDAGEKAGDKTGDKTGQQDKTPSLPDIKTIASEETDYLIKEEKEKKKKDKDKKKKKKKKKKGYLLER